jgi:molecular chaperone DnaK
LGRFHLRDLPPAPRGVPQIEVAFDIDANGILKVTAKDKATGKEANVTITQSSGLSKDEVEKMVKDAAANEATDKERRAQIELKNKAENLAYSLEKLAKDNKEKLSAESHSALEASAKELHDLREKGDKAALEAAISKAEQVSYKAAEEMYKAAGATPAGSPVDAAAAAAAGEAAKGAGAAAGAKKDDVVDAEFRSN